MVSVGGGKLVDQGFAPETNLSRLLRGNSAVVLANIKAQSSPCSASPARGSGLNLDICCAPRLPDRVGTKGVPPIRPQRHPAWVEQKATGRRVECRLHVRRRVVFWHYRKRAHKASPAPGSARIYERQLGFRHPYSADLDANRYDWEQGNSGMLASIWFRTQQPGPPGLHHASVSILGAASPNAGGTEDARDLLLVYGRAAAAHKRGRTLRRGGACDPIADRIPLPRLLPIRHAMKLPDLRIH